MNKLFLLIAIIALVLFEAKSQHLNKGLMAYDAVNFYRHLKENINYPEDAREKGIQGVVYVELKIDSTGTMEKKSVRILFGLTPSCNKEVERVVALYSHRWSKSKETDEQTFIIPVKFVLTDYGPSGFPSHILSFPAKTVVVPKKTNARVPSWSVYALKGLNNVIGNISPGDSVVVSGWAAGCYFIQTKNISGFISKNALMNNSEMEFVASEMEEKSAEEEVIEGQQHELWTKEFPSDTIKNYSLGTAHLSLTSSKNSILLGECTTITLAFNVQEDNKSNLYFIEAGAQMAKIVNEELDLPGAFVVNNNISDIQGQKSIINNKSYVTYKLFQGSYCPNKSQSIQIPSIKFYMRVDESVNEKSVKKIAEFKTKPLVIAVRPLTAGDITSYSRYKMVGNFTIEEDTNHIIVNKGDSFTFKVKIKGKGLLFPLEPPQVEDLFLKTEFIEIHDNDTIINDELYSDKTFTYRVTSEMEGAYDLGKVFNFSFFNPEKNNIDIIKSSLRVIVKNNDKRGVAPAGKPSFYRSNFIVMDVSQSMLIEDCSPNRLGAVNDGVSNFLKHQKDCNIGLMPFGGNAYVLDNDIGLCYADLNLDSLPFMKQGTAIGDAIWLALVSMSTESTSKKIIIIGDGDGTAGTLSPMYAAELAKVRNVRIYSISIGKAGMVPYGQDKLGNKNYILSPFSDVDFRNISKLTGGEYYHAEDSKMLTEILTKILSE